MIRLLVFLLTMSGLAQAQNLDEAYQRELRFLEDQSKSLTQWKTKLRADRKRRSEDAQRELELLNSELANLTVANQTELENVQRWEKLLKDAAGSGPQLEKNLQRFEERLLGLRGKVPLNPLSPIASGTTPADAFRVRLEDGLRILEELRRPQRRSHAFINESGKLVSGEVLSLGLFGAFGFQGKEKFLLAPHNESWLEVSENPAQDQILLFDPSFQRSGLKTHSGWKERAADAAPALIMVLIMLTVLFLFVALARA